MTLCYNFIYFPPFVKPSLIADGPTNGLLVCQFVREAVDFCRYVNHMLVYWHGVLCWQLGPNVTIGKNCVVGEGVRVRESVVLEGAVLQVRAKNITCVFWVTHL